MSRFTDRIKDLIPNDFFTDTELMRILSKSPDSRFGLVKRAIACGDIIRIRRGLYALSKRHQRNRLDLFELAQAICGPSYISLESALSYHGWIPEGVPTTTSVSPKRAREFHTPLGVFSFSRFPKFNFIGVERIRSGRSLFLMANPTKALVDLALVLKMDWKGMDPLVSGLRIEREFLEKISMETLERLKFEKSSRISHRFITGLMEDVNR